VFISEEFSSTETDDKFPYASQCCFLVVQELKNKEMKRAVTVIVMIFFMG